MKLSVITVTFNNEETISDHLKSLQKTLPDQSEIIIVDNASSDSTVEIVKSFKRVELVSNSENLGFSKANNQAARVARGEFLFFINPDVQIEGSIKTMLDYIESNPEVGILAPKLIDSTGKTQESVSKFPTLWGAVKEYLLDQKNSYDEYAPKTDQPVEVEVVYGAAMLLPAQVFKKIGGFNQKYFLFYEDIDLCKKVHQLSLKVIYFPSVVFKHWKGVSMKEAERMPVGIRTLSWFIPLRASGSRYYMIKSTQLYHGVTVATLIRILMYLRTKIERVKLNTLACLLIILILSFPAVAHLTKPGFFSMHDDIQVMRLFEMNKCLTDGQIPCRWVPDMGAGFGHPLFNYHPVLGYYTGALIHSLGFSYIDSVKLLFALTLVLSGFFMFFLTREFFGKLAGVVAAVFFVYAPYHAVDTYVRGALTEDLGILFLPVIFFFLYKYIKKQHLGFFLGSILSLSALLLAHNITALIFVPIALVWSLVWLVYEHKLKLLWSLAMIFGLSLGLSAFFVLPSILELNQINVLQNSGYYNFHDHFVSLGQLFLKREFGYGGSQIGNDDSLSFQIGWPHWWILLSSIILAVILAIKKKKYPVEVIFLILLTVGAIFMTHSKSVVVWNFFSFLTFVQFPWRFLGIVIFGCAFLAAFFISFWSRGVKFLLTVTLILMAIVLNGYYFQPEKHFYDLTDQQMLSGENFKRQSMTTLLDYVPKDVKKVPDQLAPSRPYSSFPEVESGEMQKGSNTWNFLVQNQTSMPILLHIPVFNYPRWRVLIDGKDTVVSSQDQTGVIDIMVPAGQHFVLGTLTNTFWRSFGNNLSVVTLLALILLVLTRTKALGTIDLSAWIKNARKSTV